MPFSTDRDPPPLEPVSVTTAETAHSGWIYCTACRCWADSRRHSCWDTRPCRHHVEGGSVCDICRKRPSRLSVDEIVHAVGSVSDLSTAEHMEAIRGCGPLCGTERAQLRCRVRELLDLLGDVAQSFERGKFSASLKRKVNRALESRPATERDAADIDSEQ